FDIRAALKRSLIGGLLNTEECLNVASTNYGGRQAKAFIENLEETTLPILKALAEQITPLRDLEQRINRCIDDHGHDLESDYVKLHRIRSIIRTYESGVEESFDNYTSRISNILSDIIVTIRKVRYVLLVNQEYRGTIAGTVH